VSDAATVTVVGVGSAKTDPDTLTVGLGVVAVADTPAAALDGAARALHAVRTAVLDSGVPEQRLQTSRLTLQPSWDHHGKRPRVAGYATDVGLAVTLDDVEGLGGLLDAAVAAGGEAARVNGMRWQIHDVAAAEALARAAAFADARRRAEHYAAMAGRQLGAVTVIEEQSGPYPGANRAFALAASAGKPSFDADPGELDVVSTIKVTWELD
jgi:uncharacterized protein